MEIKHSKYKNTGILFELLVHQITQDTLKGIDSPSISLIKNYFTKSELGREYKLYDYLIKSKTINESRANLLLSTVLDNSKKLNRGSLKRQKYNLIKELKKHYNLDDFFNVKIPNYKVLASIYTLIESYNSSESSNPKQIINNKVTLLEHLTKQEIEIENVEKDVLEEFKTYDKDLRSLTYMILLNKFNEKYDGLSSLQKSVLREFISLGDSAYSLRNFYNEKITKIKKLLKEEIVNIKDKIVKIKSDEVLKFLVEVGKNEKVNYNNVVDLLQYCELLKEIQNANTLPVNEKV